MPEKEEPIEEPSGLTEDNAGEKTSGKKDD
ncbi:hypothetical protein ANME2D_00219 [Candidatus Methanoperedens nitroreducens]|uniref:Uncharacterized protein n=1 Tax=Candidatus Methanoperedens nitratireducens TaxID=1392998 RepID=A0A062VD26_9EURY|nr:hypothetical protein ANME2D_00219 [Candidatus Methanoperedens nitroreducens]